MNITKLTLAPLFPKAKKMEFIQPDTERATRLIKERMNCNSHELLGPVKQVRHKLPKHLKGFVNPETWVATIKK